MTSTVENAYQQEQQNSDSESQTQFTIPVKLESWLRRLNPTAKELENYEGETNPFEETGTPGSEFGYYNGQINLETKQKEGKGLLIKIPDEENPTKITYYEGYFYNDLYNGPGFLLEPGIRLSQGNWEDGKLNGEGTILDLRSHYEYTGGVYQGLPHGFGELRYENGYSYSGDFKNFLKHGKGTLTYANGDVYKGNFEENFKSGFGVMKWRDGRKYKGYWQNGEMHGRGYYQWSDGGSYNGNYIFGKKEGYGVFTWANGNRYEGYFRNGKRAGKGIISLKSGEVFKGFCDEEEFGEEEGSEERESEVSFDEEEVNSKNVKFENTEKIKNEDVPKLNLKPEENENDLEVEYPDEDSDSMKFADHFSECDERKPIEAAKVEKPFKNQEIEEPEVMDSMDFADEFSECNERNFVPGVVYYQQEQEIDYEYDEVNTDSDPSFESQIPEEGRIPNEEAPQAEEVETVQNTDRVTENPAPAPTRPNNRLPSHRANNLHEEGREKTDVQISAERCSRRIPDEGNIKIPKIVTRNLKPLIHNNSDKEFQGFSVVSENEQNDLMVSGLLANKVTEYNPKRKDHQPFFFERVKKFFSFSLNDKYMVLLKEWTVMKIDIQKNVILDEIEFRQHSDNYYDNDPLPEPTNIFYSKKNNDLIIFFQEYKKMDYKVIDLDDMTRSASKKFIFNKVTETDLHLNKIYDEGKFEIRYIPNNFRILDEVYFKIFKPVESDCSNHTDEDEMVYPPVLIGLDYHKGTCKTMNKLCPYSENIINYPFIFPDLNRIVNLNFSIETYEWRLVMKNLTTEETLLQKIIGFSLDDMLSCLVDLGDSKFYTIDRVKSYLFDDRYFIFFVETDLFEYRIKPWLWDLDKEELGISFFADLKTDKNRYIETRFEKTNDRRCTIGAFRKEDVGDLIFNLPQRVEDGNWIRYEEWQDFIQIYKIYDYDRYRGGYLSSKIVNSALGNKPIILIDEKTTSVKQHCHSVFKYEKGGETIERLTDIEFKNYYALEQEDKLDFAERFIKENKEAVESDEEGDVISKNGIIHWENDNIVVEEN